MAETKRRLRGWRSFVEDRLRIPLLVVVFGIVGIWLLINIVRWPPVVIAVPPLHKVVSIGDLLIGAGAAVLIAAALAGRLKRSNRWPAWPPIRPFDFS